MLKADPSSKSRVANDALGVGLRLLEDFDAENLAQLREIDGGALLTRTLQSFAVEIGTSRTDLAGLIAKRDTFGACRLVHKLVGFGDILGARTLSAKLRKFEGLIRDDDIEVLEGSLEWIDDVMAKTRVQVDHLIEETERQREG
jgi:HPt (histidine-containing phosphotransfer) domain-containing protein